jgi:hypothetical protein
MGNCQPEQGAAKESTVPCLREDSPTTRPLKNNPMPSPPTPKPRPRWRTMSLRALMLLIVVVGGWLGWICYRARVQREAVAAIRAASGEVVFNWEWDSAKLESRDGTSEPGWLRRHLGPGFFEEATAAEGVFTADDALMVHIGRLPKVESVNLRSSAVTDAGMAHLAPLKALRFLSLWGTRITDNGLKHLEGTQELRQLDLSVTRITDAGLAIVGRLKNLETLSLNHTAVTDAGLLRLTALNRCKAINARDTKVTPAGIAAMKAKCPWMNIVVP